MFEGCARPRNTRRPRLATSTSVTASVVLTAALAATSACTSAPDLPVVSPPPSRPPAASATGPAAPLPSLSTDADVVWASWSLLDRSTDTVAVRGGQPGTSDTASMIKIAVVAQYLAEAEAQGRTPDDQEMDMMSRAIRDSDNQATETLYRRAGGDRMLRAVVQACRLTETTTTPGLWSQTQMTSADAALMGSCLAAGRVCGPEWATWLLAQMRQVRGVGRFGIIDGLPADTDWPLAIKNGWIVRDDGLWHVNCLAVAESWTLAVMIRYRARRGLELGATVCRDIAALVASRLPGATQDGPPLR